MRVAGRVQGVGFRAFVRRTAGGLAITGTVRNLVDGTVEAHLEGEAAALAAMAERMRDGPRHAEVTEIEITDAEVTGATTFTVLPTA